VHQVVKKAFIKLGCSVKIILNNESGCSGNYKPLLKAFYSYARDTQNEHRIISDVNPERNMLFERIENATGKDNIKVDPTDV
jgi:hypothetical protein